MKKLNIAVAGTGTYGKNHLGVYTSNPNANLVVVCDLKREVMDKVGQDYQMKTYNGMEEMLKSEETDAASVAILDPYHKDPVMTAMRYGKDVLAEKPLATTSVGAYDIIEAAEKTGVRVTVGYHKRWDPTSMAVKSKLADAGTGKPVRGYMCMDNVYDVAINWLNWSSDSSSVHFVGTYCYDLIHWYVGCEVVRVYAVGYKGILQEKGVDTYDSITVILEFENGCTWTVENAWTLPNGLVKVDDGCSEILCEHAMIRVDSQKRGVEFSDDQKQYTPNICLIQNHNGRAIGFGIDLLNDFAGCILHDKPFVANLNDGLEAELVAEAVHKSAGTRQVVKVERR